MGREQMLSTMDSREITEWMIYDSINPIGDRRGDIQAATITANLVTALTGKKQKIDKFIPKYDRKGNKKPQTAQQMLNVAMALNAAFGGDFVGFDE